MICKRGDQYCQKIGCDCHKIKNEGLQRMTIPEITAYVMALSVEDVRRLTATEIMGVTWPNQYWAPDVDRNQSRHVTDKVGWDHDMRGRLEAAILQVTGTPNRAWQTATPDQESRAALIAHMIHKEASNGDTV